jgi:Zinc knuckle
MGLTDASDDNLRAKALGAMTKCDDLINEAGQMIRPEPNEVLAPLMRLYAVMDQRGIYGPSKKTKTPLAMQAKVDSTAKTTLESDMSSGQSQREVRKCYECGSPDHIKSNCPKLQKSPSRSSYQISGLSSQENDEVDKLISRTRLPH